MTCCGRLLTCLLLVPPVLLMLEAGCRSSSSTTQPSYQTLSEDAVRDTRRASELNTRAVAAMDKSDWQASERMLKDALTADIGYGPAHNNLGSVYYHQNHFYQAAWEYQYAIKLMPDASEPHNNLGLVYESAGKLDDAAEQYRQAQQLDPDNLQYVGNLARVLLRQGKKDAEVKDLLQRIVEQDTRPHWVQWAREQLARVSGR